MALKILYQAATGDFDKAMRSIQKPIAEAATGAMTSAVAAIKSEGRADIAKAGFGKRWQNTFRVDQYPRRGRVSINAAALVYHKIPYADVFETGATIRGRSGKLWLPLKDTPKKIGRNRMTPQRFVQQVGPLFPIRGTGKLLLGANMAISSRAEKTGRFIKPTLAKLRQGAAGAGLTRAVPLFVGVDSVKLRDRFSLREITDRAAADLPRLYAANLNAGE